MTITWTDVVLGWLLFVLIAYFVGQPAPPRAGTPARVLWSFVAACVAFALVFGPVLLVRWLRS